MKRLIFVSGLIILSVSSLLAQETTQQNRSYGILFMAGMRYDDVRMCVATDAGEKGGSMADVQLVIRWELSDDKTLAFNLPVMRPILFFSAFNMLQFEPEVNLEMYIKLENGTTIITGPGLGISFHYGPDYESDLEDRGESFAAVGPIFNWKWAIVLNPDRNSLKTIGAKVFYTPLFAEDHADGKVIGAALEYQMGF